MAAAALFQVRSLLEAREPKLFGGHDDSNPTSTSASSPTSSPSTTSSAQCPALPSPVDDADKVIGPFTIHQFLQILAGACGILAIIISMILFFQHAFNIRNPREQIKIMRIITIIPVFAGLAYACLCLGQSSIYLKPWIVVWEGICVCTFFLLVLSYIHADPDTQMQYFERLPMLDKKKQPTGDSCAGFYKRCRTSIFQMLPVLFIISIATDVTQGINIYCINSNKPQHAHIFLTVLNGITTTVAVLAIIRFCSRLRTELPDRKLWAQLFAFKGIVGLSTTQDFIFGIVAGQVTPTTTLSYNDISVGLPNAMVICEMVIFAAAFHRFYSHKPYCAGGANALTADRVMSPGLAIAKAFNPLEVFEGALAAFTGKAGGKRAYAMGANYEMTSRRSSEENMINKPGFVHRPQMGAQYNNAGYQGPAESYDSHAYQNPAYYPQGGRMQNH